MPTITAHCIIKNEENFVGYAIRSVIDFVDQILVFDTGSTDKTAEIVKKLVSEYPTKIILEEKGECDKKRHTELRQEMLERTTTEWFMILDGDEVWTRRGTEEAKKLIAGRMDVECLIAPFYLCVGDVYHHSTRGKYKFFSGSDKKYIHASARLFKIKSDLRWNIGPYGEGDFIKDDVGNIIRVENSLILENKYWHTSALIRSSKDNEVSLGRHKQVMTYSLKLIGEGLNIKENLPEVFALDKTAATKRMSCLRSWYNLVLLIFYKMKLTNRRYYE